MASAMTGACHQQLPEIVTPNLRDGDLRARDNEFHMIIDKESEDNDVHLPGIVLHFRCGLLLLLFPFVSLFSVL